MRDGCVAIETQQAGSSPPSSAPADVSCRSSARPGMASIWLAAWPPIVRHMLAITRHQECFRLSDNCRPVPEHSRRQRCHRKPPGVQIEQRLGRLGLTPRCGVTVLVVRTASHAVSTMTRWIYWMHSNPGGHGVNTPEESLLRAWHWISCLWGNATGAKWKLSRTGWMPRQFT